MQVANSLTPPGASTGGRAATTTSRFLTDQKAGNSSLLFNKKPVKRYTTNPLSNFSFLVGSQIRFLVTNLNKKNFKTSVTELHHLIELYGNDAYLYLLRALVSNIDFRDLKQKDQSRIQLLSQEVATLMKQPNFASCICQALEGLESIQEDFISHFSKVIKLTLQQEILIALGLAHSVDPNIKQEGNKFLKSKVGELSTNLLKTLPENVLHSLLYLLRTEGLSKQSQSILKALQKQPAPQTLIPLFTEVENPTPNSKEVYSKEVSKQQDPIIHEILSTCHISNMMEDIGYSCCETVANLQELLIQFPDLKESDVAMILGMMARTHSSLDGGVALYKDFPPTTDFTSTDKSDQSVKSWNINIFVDVIKEMFPKLNWPNIVKQLDHPGFYVPDPKGLALIMSVYRKASKETFPLEYLFDTWKNTAGQLSFLKLALSAPPDMFNFAASSRRIDAEGLPSVGKAVPTLHQSWYSLSLVETLLRLAETENYTVVRNIFNYPIKHCPELLCIGLAQAKVPWNTLAAELVSLLMPNILMSNNASSNFTIHKLWTTNPNLLVRGMVELYSKDPVSLSRLLEIATQDLKALTHILDAKPFSFVIDLAALASRREFLNLEKWLQEKINEHGNTFVRACVAYIKEKILKTAKNESNQRIYETLNLFYGCLHSNINSFSPDIIEELKALSPKFQAQAKSKYQSSEDLSLMPGVMGQGSPGSDMSGITGNPGMQGQGNINPSLPAESRSFPPEVEEPANALFQKMYTGQISIDEIITLLKRFKNSKDQREQDIFACMIHNLYDEYRFFPRYPDKELQLTGVLFGSLIQHQLISFLPLGVALRYVLDALRKPPGSKMFKFGLTALEQFKSRLPEWPQYCSHILAIPHMSKVHPELTESLEKHLSQAASTPSVPSSTTPPPIGATPPPTATTPPPSTQTPPLQFNPNNAEKPPDVGKQPVSIPSTPPPKGKESGITDQHSLPLEVLLRQVRPPPPIDEVIKDKIHFVFNNVSISNLDPKVAELKLLLKDDDTLQYLSFYLVIKRVSIEFNFHGLYLTVLEKLKLTKLNNYLLGATLESIKILWKTETIISSIEQKTLLKNLGSWLGLITLGRNKPLLQKDLALKELLFEGYENGKLIIAIPFVCKVLETCASSKVFKPPNPWVMAIMKVLKEIYNMPTLRLSLKFEVEMICKTLQLDKNEVKPSDCLASKKQYIGPNNLDFNPPPQAPSQAQQNATTPTPVTEQRQPSPRLHELPDITEEIDYSDPDAEPFVQTLAKYLNVPPSIPLFNQQPQLKKCIPVAIDRAIREIITPVVERSVTIASVTSRELILKDFATEGDEQKMRKAAHLMVQNLAGSLALVTCKDPLRVSMITHLRNLLQSNTHEQYHPLIENAIQIISTDNLDLACTLIEKAATDKAVRETDDGLSAALLARRKHKERNLNQPFLDINFASGRYPAALPESLRPRIGGLLGHQLRVYDDFARIPHVQPSQYPESQLSREESAMLNSNRKSPVEQQLLPGQELLSIQMALEKFTMILNELDNLAARHPGLPLHLLPPDNDLRKLILQIPLLITQSANRAEVILAFSQRIVRTIFESDSSLQQDIYILALESIAELFRKIVKEVTMWITYLDDERKFNRVVMTKLIQHQLLSVIDFDPFIAKSIETGRKLALDFAIHIVRYCLIEHHFIPPTDLRETLEILSKLSRTKGQEDILKLLEEVKAAAGVPQNVKDMEANYQLAGMFKDESVRVFEEWVAILTQPNPSEKQVVAHLALLSQGVLKDEESSNRFFRVALELAVDSALMDKPSYIAVDAFCKLIVFLLKYTENPNAKIGILSRILGIVVRVLLRDYETKKTRFNQRPYYRIFATWLVDLSLPDPNLEAINLQILLAFSNAFSMLRPSRMPAFSFAWLELISHRMFMPKLLLAKGQKGWPLFQRLLVELFKFLEPFLRKPELTDPIRMMYKGTLRVLLVLLHDFPEFLCDYHFSFCDALPPTCIQLRNLILSAFPRNMRLPDPFTPNLKVDLLPEINQPPRILSNYGAILGNEFLAQIDNYLKNRGPVTFLMELKSYLIASPQEQHIYGSKYNVSAINALVIHLGIQAIAQLKSGTATPIPHSPPMDIFQRLALDLDTEGRYLFLNAIANQLRYPNSHTHYFSCVLLYLFAESNQEVIQEQITRVLLERLIVNRPHPWGLLITFIELIKNPRYNFWGHGFTRCAPEIERLFESVARSVHGPAAPQKQEDQ